MNNTMCYHDHNNGNGSTGCGNGSNNENYCAAADQMMPFMPIDPRLAYTFTPYQQSPDSLYTPTEGLMHGTIFPELNIPLGKYEVMGGNKR